MTQAFQGIKGHINIQLRDLKPGAIKLCSSEPNFKNLGITKRRRHDVEKTISKNPPGFLREASIRTTEKRRTEAKTKITETTSVKVCLLKRESTFDFILSEDEIVEPIRVTNPVIHREEKMICEECFGGGCNHCTCQWCFNTGCNFCYFLNSN